jgi:hypothetical protein
MNDLASSMFEVLCLFMGKDILYLESWRSSPPGMFASLVSPNPHESSAARARCKAVYEALLVAEKASLSKPGVCAFLDSLLWPRAVWVREILIALSECKWEHTPQDLKSELQSSFMRHGTKTVEDMIGFVRKQLRANSMGQLGPLRQWHRLIDCGILTEEDQKPIHATTGDNSLPTLTSQRPGCMQCTKIFLWARVLLQSSWQVLEGHTQAPSLLQKCPSRPLP